MEANERWLEFSAEGTYRARPLEFEWRARLSVMLGIWVIATDGQAHGDGWGRARLWGLKSMGARSGPDVHALQLIRNIAELAWLPELALADPALRWSDAGEEAFEIGADATARTVSVRFDVDEAGDIRRASCTARPHDVPEGFEDAPWHCDFSDHADFDGVRLPATVVATYDFPDDPWQYFRAEVTGLERSTATD